MNVCMYVCMSRSPSALCSRSNKPCSIIYSVYPSPHTSMICGKRSASVAFQKSKAEARKVSLDPSVGGPTEMITCGSFFRFSR